MHISNAILQSIHQVSTNQFEHVRQIRRDLHQHPELSGHEAWTAGYISQKLSEIGLVVRDHAGGHGIVADLIVSPAKPTVAFRVDMDALPIQEINRVPYRSQINGIMHACGHDVHSAIGIGVASVLSMLKESLPGNIRFLFQPEEEEITGALRMIHNGALANPKPAAIFGLHVAPLPAGQVAWTDDLFLSGFDHYLVSLSPQKGWDIRLSHMDAIARRCCRAIQSLNQWELPMTWDQMQEFWQLMQSGPKALREFIVYDATLDEEDPDAWPGQFGVGIKAASIPLRKTAFGRVKAAINALCRATHTRYHIEKMGTMIDMRNHSQLVRSTLPALQSALGANQSIQLKAAFPFNCEDFAFYTQRVPGAMYWLGAANPNQGKYALLHTPDFDVDELCLHTGTVAMASLLWEALLVNTIQTP
jgi:amidohydrolase